MAMAIGELADQKTAKVIAGGAGTETIAGIGAIVLSILGLVGVQPIYMLSIACMAIGAALLSQSVSVADRQSELMDELTEDEREKMALGTGIGVEFAGGTAGVILGILALMGVTPGVLIPIAAVVFGAALLLSTGEVLEFSRFVVGRMRNARLETISRKALKAASGTQVIVGLSAIALGILALVGMAPLTLALVAMLIVGCSAALSGAALGGRMGLALRA